ncbi:hypothetical protein AGRA3207_007547 [Actinomadura graeca]|uniref:Uncharacterized protein n=1 Tax=Actinomadura graeca TaxID=2750812 RepID=A0ABX8R4G1_9ACTN|nr:hypothetical protein [Actinomadura graeca]QXJ25975.1 hypothetical protein AGRA3207_007547 [Actinomadura graeca]
MTSISPLPAAITRELPALVEEALNACANAIIDRLLEELEGHGLHRDEVCQDRIYDTLSSASTPGEDAHGLALELNDVLVHIQVAVAGSEAASAAAPWPDTPH